MYLVQLLNLRYIQSEMNLPTTMYETTTDVSKLGYNIHAILGIVDNSKRIKLYANTLKRR